MCRAKLSLALAVVVVGHQWLSVTEKSENGKNWNDGFCVAEVESSFLSPGKCLFKTVKFITTVKINYYLLFVFYLSFSSNGSNNNMLKQLSK